MPDRIYSIQYNGRIYDVRAPQTAMPSELFAYVRSQVAGEAQGPKEEENLLEKIPVVGGVLASVADVPLNVASGLAGTAKTFTDVFGADNAASNFLGEVSQYAESLTSAQSREDEKTAAAIRKEAEGKGIWEEVKAAARSFAVNPIDTAASVVGSALPFAAAAASGVGVPGLVGLGAASGVGTVKGAISDAVYARAREAGVPEEQAKIMAEEAQAYGGENLDMQALGGVLGAVASSTGFDKQLGRAIAKRAVTDVIESGVEQQAARGVVRRGVTGFGAEALPEAGQAGQERFAQNLAEQRAGYETDLMAGVAGQAAFEGLAGGILGGVGGVAERGAPRPAATDEELADERSQLEEAIVETGMPEAQDPEIRVRAAALMQSGTTRDPVEAVEAAIYLRDQQQTELEESEVPNVTEPDVGGGEPSVSIPDVPEAGAGLTREPTESGDGRVGVAGAPAGQVDVGEGPSAAPLEPQSIIPPIEAVSPQASIVEQLAAVVPEAAPVAPAPSVVPEITPETYVDRYLAGEGRGDTPADLELQQYAANNPAEIEAEFAKRAAPEETPAPVEEAVKVAEIDPSLPEDVQAAQAEVNEFNPGFEIRYSADNGRRRYSYGVVGGKVEFASPNLNSVKNRILNEKPLKPKQVIEGVPVKRMPPGEAEGAKPKPQREMQLQPEKPSIAGKLAPAQQEQRELLLYEIDEARNARQISNAERTELVDMLRTPQGKELARSREWTMATAIQNDLDALTKEGTKLRDEEKLAKAQNNLTPAKEKEFAKRAKDIAKRTKTQSDELAKAKSGIYQRAREKLTERKETRRKRIEQIKRNYERGLISDVVYKREMSEARPQFRKAKGKAAGITLQELNAAVKDITDRWGVGLEPKMVQSATDLPPAIRKELEDLDRTDAFGFYKDGKAYLIADNMNGVEDVAPTLYHEALGHLGLRKLFREGLDNVLTDIYRTNKGVAALADKWLSANQDLYAKEENPTARAVEEVLASASEAGPLRASRMGKLMNFIKDFARKYLGFDFKFSDREVRTILGMAHEQALSGEGTVMGSSSTMFSTPEQKKAKRTTADAAVSAQDAIEKIITTTADQMDMERRGVLDDIGDTLKGKTFKNWFGGPNRGFDRGWVNRGGLKLTPTDGALDLMTTMVGDNPTTTELRNAVDAADKMNGTRSATRRMLNRTVTDLKEYLLSNADPIVFQGKKRKALPVAMDYGNYYNMDMVGLMDAKSREDALKSDQIWRKYNKLLQDPALDAKKKADFEGKLKKRAAEIDGGLEVVSNLSKEGRALYKRVRDMNRDMHDMRQFLMSKRVESLRDAGLSDDAVSKLMVSIRAEQERLNDKVNAPSKEDAHTEYPEVPLGLFHREYFPKRRYGDYWLRIKKTKFGEPILRFYESRDERDADLEAAAKEFGINKDDENSGVYLDAGNDAKRELGDDFDTENAFIKTLNLVSNIDPATFSESKKAQLRSDVYQLYLLSTPEGSGRKQFIKSKNRLGWSSDILRTVGATAEEYASDIARLRYVPEIDRAITAAKKSYESLPVTQKEQARTFVTDIEGRIQGEMEPQPKGFVNKIVPWANQWAYISFLTAPATALVQVTALPMRVAPNLWGKYGLAQTTRAMGRYMNVFNNLPKLESTTKAARKTLRIPTLMESNIVKNSKRHRDALTRATDEYGLIMPLSEFTMGQERTPQTAAQGRGSELLQKSYDAMTYMFDASEQLTREVAFMAAYDLEYDKLADAKLSPEERQNKAIIAAKDTVNYTLGNYTSLNRPPIMKGSELARALFLFKQYSVITTRFFVQGTRAIFGKGTPRDERVAAIKEMTGVLSMGFLMGGVTGLPLYTLGMMTLQAMQDAFDDDEDRKERMKKNPITADSVELQFRYEWLPEHFGQPMTTDANGKKITLGDIILNGAVSEATGWNFGSRVSLDIAGMWFRAPKDADTWSQTVNNALVENIPGASASLNVVSMGEEVAKGNLAKGLEVGLPAVFRAPFKAYRLSEEGLRTQTEKVKLKKEEFSNAEIIGTVFGFNPTQVAKTQQQNRDVLNRVNDLKEQKRELLGAYNRAVRRIQNGDADGQEKAREAFKDIMEYNKKVGNPYFGISYANIYKSLTGAAAEGKDDIQGMGLNQVESYYAEKTLSKQ